MKVKLNNADKLKLEKYAKLFNEQFDVVWGNRPAINLDTNLITLPQFVSFDQAWTHLDHEIGHYMFKSKAVLQLLQRMARKVKNQKGADIVDILFDLVNLVEDYRVDESWRMTPFKGTYAARVEYVRTTIDKRKSQRFGFDLGE